jgi:hypothetical protein
MTRSQQSQRAALVADLTRVDADWNETTGWQTPGPAYLDAVADGLLEAGWRFREAGAGPTAAGSAPVAGLTPGEATTDTAQVTANIVDVIGERWGGWPVTTDVTGAAFDSDPTDQPVTHETPGAYAGTMTARDRLSAIVARFKDASDVMVRKADLRQLLAEHDRARSDLARAVVPPSDARMEIERDLGRVQAQGATVAGQAATISTLIESWRADVGLPAGVPSRPGEAAGGNADLIKQRCADELRAMVARLDAFISRHGPITRDDMFEILMERAAELAPQSGQAPKEDAGQWGVRWPGSVWIAPLDEC